MNKKTYYGIEQEKLREKNYFLNKKRKNSENTFKSTEDDINEIINDKNKIYDKYMTNNELREKVVKIFIEKDELVALVEKRMKNEKIKIETIKTKDLKLNNPWILIDFYENNNINL